jgi:2-polyprenyl-3-methyl-5-hydroxy-6-metoxy-1,4-benzoquinol methylase
MKLNIRFEDRNDDWQIWSKNSSIERSIKRVKKQLPEMEASKQLLKILKNKYRKGYAILDFGCAAGHFYHSLKKIDKNIKYFGFDSTKNYIKFAKKFFKKEKNVKFDLQSLYSMSKKYYNKFDIVFCSNVLHHLPSIDIPLKNLILASKKFCIIRTLVSDNTHLSRFYYNDKTNKKGELNNFQFQNTYSYSLIKKKIRKIGNYKIKFLDDVFDGTKINKEYTREEKKKYPGLTHFVDGIQIAGSKVFEFKWIIIKK